MPHDSDQRSHSRPAHSSFFENRKLPLIPSLVVGSVFLLALLFLTVPNWSEFSRNVSQFPALWQINSNRREIIFLVIRVCSPLLLATIAGACCWLWYTIKVYLREEAPPARVQLQGSMLPSSPMKLSSSTTSSMQGCSPSWWWIIRVLLPLVNAIMKGAHPRIWGIVPA